LTWCYDGALAAVDCAASQQTCTTAGEVPDCESPPEKAAPPER
jgi:hypothetical protein